MSAPHPMCRSFSTESQRKDWGKRLSLRGNPRNKEVGSLLQLFICLCLYVSGSRCSMNIIMAQFLWTFSSAILILFSISLTIQHANQKVQYFYRVQSNDIKNQFFCVWQMSNAHCPCPLNSRTRPHIQSYYISHTHARRTHTDTSPNKTIGRKKTHINVYRL